MEKPSKGQYAVMLCVHLGIEFYVSKATKIYFFWYGKISEEKFKENIQTNLDKRISTQKKLLIQRNSRGLARHSLPLSTLMEKF